VQHDGDGLFDGLPRPLEVARYHSLVVDRDTLPSSLRVTATTADGLVMAMQHRDDPLYGVQFHPESIATPEGPKMLRNFLVVCGETEG
jgi:anthranilate/para-aminobenzoate synthase component II